jgi:hypothetical protein
MKRKGGEEMGWSRKSELDEKIERKGCGNRAGKRNKW